MTEPWVYRDGRRRESRGAVLAELGRRLARVHRSERDERRREAVAALVVAGELEAALADAGDPETTTSARVTDALAAIVLGGDAPLDAAIADVERIARAGGGDLHVSTPEGFAWYALHPEAYARATSELGDVRDMLVVGVRSIGTTLSAVARAALLARGVHAQRTTVRPDGPPNDRHLSSVFAPPPGATVLVVDEGPGLSGSTFLAVAEAFVRAGVPASRVVLMCSHAVDVDALRAPRAASRWRAFRTIVADEPVHAPDGRDLSAGAWRRSCYAREAEWPATFPNAERRKVLSGGRLFKYEGLGLRASSALDRARALAAERWIHAARDEGDGWWSYPWDGRPLSARDRSPEIVDLLARYCARRASLFRADEPTDLVPVVRKNAAVILGGDPAATIELAVERPVVADARMAPHEWVRTSAGELLKTDAVAHGDDHFFPGPTDIAWDLAGAIVEWDLDGALRARLLEGYGRASGDDARTRIGAWIFAYAACRAGWVVLVRDLVDASERARLSALLARYLRAMHERA